MNIYVYGTDNMSVATDPKKRPASIAYGIACACGFHIDRDSEKESIAHAEDDLRKPLASGKGWRLYDFYGDYEDFNLVIDEEKFPKTLVKALRAYLQYADRIYNWHEGDDLHADVMKVVESMFIPILSE